MYNSVTLIGRLGHDPEIRYTQDGKAVTTISLATNFRYLDSEGQLKEKTDWHRVVAWDKLAENINAYLKKGSLVAVIGRITTRKWQDQQGQDRYTTEIIARTVIFLNGSKNKENAPSEPQDNFSPETAEDDVPF